MQIEPTQTWELTSRRLRILEQDKLVREFSYGELPELRSQVHQFMVELVGESQLTHFSSVCGQCGNSCRREGILVREHEVLPLAFNLGINGSEFVQRYLEPARTWNPRDGILKLQDGQCPFLKAGAKPEPDSASCTVYENRPLDCQRFVSNAPNCTKSINRLIERVSKIVLGPQLCTLHLGEQAHTLDSKWHDRFGELVAEIETPESLFFDLTRLLRQLTRNYRDILPTPEQLQKLRTDIEFVAQEAGGDAAKCVEVDQLWLELSELEVMLAEPEELTALPESAVSPRLRELALTEKGLAVRFGLSEGAKQQGFQQEEESVPLFFQEHPELLDSVRAVLDLFLTRDETPHQILLTESDPPCFLCGECCRTYAVEIHPTDILRLCEHLEMTPKDFIEQHTLPGRFNWNPGSRILKKKTKKRGRPLLLPLAIAGQASPEFADGDQELTECHFLEKRDDGYYYCSVHSHKPDVCRAYTARNSLCRDRNRPVHSGRQAGIIQWLSLTPSEVRAHTYRGKADEGKLNYPRHNWPLMDQAIQALETQVLELLESSEGDWLRKAAATNSTD